jgi:hypothetical protein
MSGKMDYCPYQEDRILWPQQELSIVWEMLRKYLGMIYWPTNGAIWIRGLLHSTVEI